MNLLYIFSLSSDVGPRRLSGLYDIYFLYHYHIIGLRLTCIVSLSIIILFYIVISHRKNIHGHYIIMDRVDDPIDTAGPISD